LIVLYRTSPIVAKIVMREVRMRRLLPFAALLTAALLAAAPRLAAQKPQTLFISLTAPDGKPVADLKPTEVTVTEDGKECKILKVEPIDWPIKIQVLVDNGTANTNPINGLRDGLKAFFEQIPDGVEMSMYATAPQSRTIVKATTEKQKLIDGIALIAPERGGGAFFDSLSEAAGRVDKDKTPHFPVVMMIGSDIGRENVLDRPFQQLQENIIKHAMTVHVLLMAGGTGQSSQTGTQNEIGLALTKLSGGRYEGINSPTRLATLLPEFGKRIAQSEARQRHQYRITYERPAKGSERPSVGASVTREATPVLSLDGHMP
jgi:hypothetical protein